MTNRDPDVEVGGGGASPPHMTGYDPKPHIITQASEVGRRVDIFKYHSVWVLTIESLVLCSKP